MRWLLLVLLLRTALCQVNCTVEADRVIDSYTLRAAFLQVFPLQDGSILESAESQMVLDAEERLQQLNISLHFTEFCSRDLNFTTEILMRAVLGTFAMGSESLAVIQANPVTGTLKRVDTTTGIRTHIFEMLVLISLIAIGKCFLVIHQLKQKNKKET